MWRRYSSSVVAPMQCSSPRASIGLSMFPASIAPSAAPAPTTVCSSSMNSRIRPSAALTSCSTAFRRSSNSPRYFAPATSEPMSSAKTVLSRSPSGTSPRTIRWASPSTIAVLPTPGSPISTGLFFVLRDRIWMTRRISSSRPITGSSRPLRAGLDEVAPVLLERLVGRLRHVAGDALAAPHLGQDVEQPLARDAVLAQHPAGAGLHAGRDHGEHQVLDRDVLVLEALRLLLRGIT